MRPTNEGNMAHNHNITTLRAPIANISDVSYGFNDSNKATTLFQESGMDAASRLESQYELTYKTIDEVRKAIWDMKSGQGESSSFTSPDTKPTSEESGESVSFQFQNVSFAQKEEPIFQRLINEGQNLKLRKEILKKQVENENNKVVTLKPEITDTAKNIKRKEPIEDLLIKRKMEHEVRMEEKRKEKEQQEMSQLASPKISKQAKQIKRTEPAYERLFEVRKQNLDKREQLRNRMEAMEIKQIPGKPKINKVSQNMSRTLDDQIEWANMKREKAEIKKKQREEQEMQALQKPKINIVSARLAQMQNRGSNVFEHLLDKHKQKSEEKAQKIFEAKEREINSSIPVISAHSANLHRDQPVFDRLYQTSIEYEDRKRQLREQREILSKHSIDPQTGKRMHSPQINRKSQRLVRSEPVEKVLLQKAIEKNAKLEEAKRRENLQIADFQTTKVGEYSRLLAELLERKTNMSTQERLLTQKSINKSSLGQTMIRENEKQCTFKPSINERSRNLDRQLHSGATPRTEMLLQKGSEYENKKRQLKEQVTQERMSGCTFSPRVASPSPRSSFNVRSIAERSVEWARRIDRKLELDRQQASERELEDCTFQPNSGRRAPSVKSQRMIPR